MQGEHFEGCRSWTETLPEGPEHWTCRLLSVLLSRSAQTRIKNKDSPNLLILADIKKTQFLLFFLNKWRTKLDATLMLKTPNYIRWLLGGRMACPIRWVGSSNATPSQSLLCPRENLLPVLSRIHLSERQFQWKKLEVTSTEALVEIWALQTENLEDGRLQNVSFLYTCLKEKIRKQSEASQCFTSVWL